MHIISSATAFLGVLALLGATPAASADDPLLRPIAPDYAKRWLDPQPPVKIYGNSYMVGFGGLSVGLIDTGAGLILIDGAVPQAVRSIQANIRALGFRPEDIKYILSTEPHYDHAGGIAALARDSGATVLVGTEAAEELRTGIPSKHDQQANDLAPIPAIKKLRAMRDGETVRLGNTVLTARATPGHTAGSMSWTWQSCEDARCLNMVFAASLNPAASDGYRFSDPRNAAVVGRFRRGFAAMRALPCDIVLTSHPGQSDGEAKYAQLRAGSRPNPYIDPHACRTLADMFAKTLEERMAKEGK